MNATRSKHFQRRFSSIVRCNNKSRIFHCARLNSWTPRRSRVDWKSNKSKPASVRWAQIKSRNRWLFVHSPVMWIIRIQLDAPQTWSVWNNQFNRYLIRSYALWLIIVTGAYVSAMRAIVGKHQRRIIIALRSARARQFVRWILKLCGASFDLHNCPVWSRKSMRTSKNEFYIFSDQKSLSRRHKSRSSYRSISFP